MIKATTKQEKAKLQFDRKLTNKAKSNIGSRHGECVDSSIKLQIKSRVVNYNYIKVKHCEETLTSSLKLNVVCEVCTFVVAQVSQGLVRYRVSALRTSYIIGIGVVEKYWLEKQKSATS